jgi:hypothetical protein
MGLTGAPSGTDEPSAGDHLVIRRSGYTHHGIYLGSGRIAHKVAGTAALGVTLSSADASVRVGSSGGVVLTTLTGFCPEASTPTDWSCVGVVHYAEAFAPAHTVALALASAADSQPYRLLEANCEHFASWCKVGEAVSLQVLAVRGALSRFGAMTAGILAGTVVLAQLEFAERTTTKARARARARVRAVVRAALSQQPCPLAAPTGASPPRARPARRAGSQPQARGDARDDGGAARGAGRRGADRRRCGVCSWRCVATPVSARCTAQLPSGVLRRWRRRRRAACACARGCG